MREEFEVERDRELMWEEMENRHEAQDHVSQLRQR